MTYEPRIVAVTALAIACFSAGFSVTAAAYAARDPRPAPAEASAAAPVARIPAGAKRSVDVRGCTFNGP
jgi:hypothetical protein